VGALGVGAYAYYDTGQVASTAIAMFGGDFDTEVAGGDAHVDERKPGIVRRAKNAVVEKTVGGAARAIGRAARARRDGKQPPAE
jgi:hypothetical protein